jgi:chromosome segregation ATPase
MAEDNYKDVAAGEGVPRANGSRVALYALAATWLVGGGVAFAGYQTHEETRARLENSRLQFQELEGRVGVLEGQSVELRTQLDASSTKTKKELTQTRRLAQKLQKEQQAAVGQLEEHENLLGSLTGSVADVQSDVATTQEQLAQTSGRLERVVGDLGVQSGLMARNQQELEELKRLGQRDYADFRLTRSKQFNRVGPVSIRVSKVDAKRSKYTMTVLVNDRAIEKKDKTMLEPVQFYWPGTRKLVEVVVFEMTPKQVVGYVSTPKEMAAVIRPGR